VVCGSGAARLFSRQPGRGERAARAQVERVAQFRVRIEELEAQLARARAPALPGLFRHSFAFRCSLALLHPRCRRCVGMCGPMLS